MIRRRLQSTLRMVMGETVTVRVKERDQYGRHVGEVIVNGRSVNRELVREGFAWWYEQYAKDDLDLKRLHEGAKAAKRGLWKQDSPKAPWDWRRENNLTPQSDYEGR